MSKRFKIACLAALLSVFITANAQDNDYATKVNTFHMKGGDLVIKGGSGKNIYTTGLKVDGRSHDRAWIDWKDVEGGAVLEYSTSSKPSGKWASKDLPPSYN